MIRDAGAWLLYWRRSPDWRRSVISNELRHQQSRVLKRHTSGAPKDGVLCAAGNVPIRCTAIETFCRKSSCQCAADQPATSRASLRPSEHE
jgi:hypothetical protein